MKKLFCFLVIFLSFTSVFGQEINLQFNRNGKFKIVQITDTHYCKQNEQSVKNAKNIIEVLSSVLDVEKPDLAVFTGDIVTCNPPGEGWEELLEPVISRRIPYAVVFGNHDDEPEWSREQIADYLEKKPYSLFQRGSEDIKGCGNFVLRVTDREGKNAALLYFMDSNAYSKAGELKGYDWFDFNQVEWFRKSSRTFTEENQGKPYPALAFFHIPLMEYGLFFDSTMSIYFNPVRHKIFGEHKELVYPGIINTGMYAAMYEAGDVMATFVGHDHANNYIGCINGICLAYGCFSGGHARYTGARIIELHENQRSFDTWIRRVDKGKKPESAAESIEFKVNYPASFINK